MSATTRTVCFVSDRTGVTAEVLGHSLHLILVTNYRLIIHLNDHYIL